MCFGVDSEFFKSHSLTDFYFCPMLDARRMEVYTAIFDKNFKTIKDISAEIIESSSFKEILDAKPTIFFGTGAEKIKEVIQHQNALFCDEFNHSTKNMIDIALEKLSLQQFEDVAYFEPFYLKDFVATVPRNNILG
jgi:tRNA threonylcarbamoyladenosine biosynthesis protein TsaB